METTPVLAPVRRWWRLSQAPAGIFGTIVGASVMAASEDDEPIADVAWSVVITLIVYWLAERWSAVLGYRLRGHALTRARVLAVFASGWPMVQASYTPVLVMVVAYLLGASHEIAVDIALGSSVLLLVALGVLAGRRAKVGRWPAAFSGVFTGGLGVVLILLKAFLH